jgi:hypothetical protein
MVVIPQLEGYVSTLVNTGVTPATAAGINTLMFEPVYEWILEMKRIMRQPGNRDLTDWAIAADQSVVNASASGLLYTGASTLYGLLWGSIDAAEGTVMVTYDHAAKTIDWPGAAPDILMRTMIWRGVVAGVGNREYVAQAFPMGIPFATAISCSADGTGGTAPAANDVSVLAVYRTA